MNTINAAGSDAAAEVQRVDRHDGGPGDDVRSNASGSGPRVRWRQQERVQAGQVATEAQIRDDLDATLSGLSGSLSAEQTRLRNAANQMIRDTKAAAKERDAAYAAHKGGSDSALRTELAGIDAVFNTAVIEAEDGCCRLGWGRWKRERTMPSKVCTGSRISRSTR